MPKINIILDCDPGIDDSLAIALALSCPDIKLEAVTTVAGNCPLETTTINAASLLELLGHREIPVVPGASQPLLSSTFCPSKIHGSNGIGDVILPLPTIPPSPFGAAKFIANRIEASSDRPLTICATGPLTNIALALTMVKTRVAINVRIIAMGASVRGKDGNPPDAGYNFFVDPHAASIVLADPIPTTLCTLETTHKITANLAWINQLASATFQGANSIAQMMRHLLETYKSRYWLDAVPLHDPGVIAYAIAPRFFDTQKLRLSVETTSSNNPGKVHIHSDAADERGHATLITSDCRGEETSSYILQMLQRKAQRSSPY